MSDLRDMIANAMSDLPIDYQHLRHIEAWMRLSIVGLHELTPIQFRLEITAAMRCVEIAGREKSEELAQRLNIW